MKDRESSRVLEIADSLYASALGDESWNVAFEKLRRFTGARCAALVSRDPLTGAPFVFSVAADDADWHTELAQRYHEEFRRFDPLTAFALQWPTGRWFEDLKDFSAETRNHGTFYQEFYRPLGIAHWTGFMVRNDHSALDFLSLLDGTAVPHAVKLRHPLDAVRAHLDRALQTRAKLNSLNHAHGAVAEVALESMGVAVILLDESRRILYANAEAHHLLETEPVALRVSGGRLIPLNHADSTQWQRACVSGAMSLQGKAGHPLLLTLVPVPPHTQLARHWQRPLTLLLKRNIAWEPKPLAQLTQAYGLTPAELALCELLAIQGLTPKECGAVRGVSEATVRTQIQSIRQKTHTKTLAQLVRLALADRDA